MRWILEVAYIGIATSWKWLLGSTAVVAALVGILFGVGVLGGGGEAGTTDHAHPGGESFSHAGGESFSHAGGESFSHAGGHTDHNPSAHRSSGGQVHLGAGPGDAGKQCRKLGVCPGL